MLWYLASWDISPLMIRRQWWLQRDNLFVPTTNHQPPVRERERGRGTISLRFPLWQLMLLIGRANTLISSHSREISFMKKLNKWQGRAGLLYCTTMFSHFVWYFTEERKKLLNYPFQDYWRLTAFYQEILLVGLSQLHYNEFSLDQYRLVVPDQDCGYQK